MSNIAFLFLPLAFSSLLAVLPFVSPSSQVRDTHAQIEKLLPHELCRDWKPVVCNIKPEPLPPKNNNDLETMPNPKARKPKITLTWKLCSILKPENHKKQWFGNYAQSWSQKTKSQHNYTRGWWHRNRLKLWHRKIPRGSPKSSATSKVGERTKLKDDIGCVSIVPASLP